MRLLLLGLIFAILTLLPPLSVAQYVPGQPGASWTEAEVLTVKAKLIQVISNGGSALSQINPNHNYTWTRHPTAAKYVRLGFHDCLKYVLRLITNLC